MVCGEWRAARLRGRISPIGRPDLRNSMLRGWSRVTDSGWSTVATFCALFGGVGEQVDLSGELARHEGVCDARLAELGVVLQVESHASQCVYQVFQA